MKKIIIIFVITLFAVSQIYSQNKFPVPVKPSDSLILVTKSGTYRLENFKDTLWVMKNSQFQNALIKAKTLGLVEEQNREYKILTDKLKEKSAEQDSLIAVYIKDRDYYQKNWKICEDDFDYLTKKCKKNNIFKKLSIIAIPVAFVVGYFVGK
jgi:hypothetical protein